MHKCAAVSTLVPKFDRMSVNYTGGKEQGWAPKM